MHNQFLKETYFSLIENYSTNFELNKALWLEIEKSYTSKNRYYHTLNHLLYILNELNSVKSSIHNWESCLFTLYYHDIIYNSFKNNNEEKSAIFARQRMEKINVKNETINFCYSQIIATKTHLKSKYSDTNYFIDADLSILGSSWDNYRLYYENIRKEYAHVPNIIYKKGRMKVINHFLKMESIFKTNHFRSKYEEIAKLNLKKEIDFLN